MGVQEVGRRDYTASSSLSFQTSRSHERNPSRKLYFSTSSLSAPLSLAGTHHRRPSSPSCCATKPPQQTLTCVLASVEERCHHLGSCKPPRTSSVPLFLVPLARNLSPPPCSCFSGAAATVFGAVKVPAFTAGVVAVHGC